MFCTYKTLMTMQWFCFGVKKMGVGRLYSGVLSSQVVLVLTLIFTFYLKDDQSAILLYFITIIPSLHSQVHWGCFVLLHALFAGEVGEWRLFGVLVFVGYLGFFFAFSLICFLLFGGFFLLQKELFNITICCAEPFFLLF